MLAFRSPGAGRSVVVPDAVQGSATLTVAASAIVGSVTGENYLVYPISPTGIFANDTIPNQDSALEWRVNFESPLDGTFEYFNGGSFRYTAGVQTGTAQFIYEIINFDGLGGNTQAVVTVDVNDGTFDVYPIAQGGIFEGQESTYTNQSATWSATIVDALDGSFTFGDGGSFTYTRGVQTGTASFTFVVNDFDGQGSNDTGTVTITVQ